MNEGESGPVLGKDREGNYVVSVDYRRKLGRWYVDAAVRGALPVLPLVNVDAKVKSVKKAKKNKKKAKKKNKKRSSSASLSSEMSISAEEENSSSSVSSVEIKLPKKLKIVQAHRQEGDNHRWSVRLGPSAEGGVVTQVRCKLAPLSYVT